MSLGALRFWGGLLLRGVIYLAALGSLWLVLLQPHRSSAQPVLTLVPPGAALDKLTDYRFCGLPPRRDADGTISRSSAVLVAYRHLHPCPATGLATGACPGWALNHVYPLVNGGCDAVSNLQWLPTQIKSCALSTGVLCVDRFEEKIFATPVQLVPALK